MTDEHFIRQAIALAAQSKVAGDEPFGAILVLDGKVVAEAHNRVITASDPTRHAEIMLISDYCQRAKLITLAGYTLYASAEPCMMCSGAIYWSRISRIVFSVSQAMLREREGSSPKPDCRSIINGGRHKAEIVGPFLAAEGMGVFEGYTSWRQAARQAHPTP